MAPGLVDEEEPAPGQPLVDLSPEARRRAALSGRSIEDRVAGRLGLGPRAMVVINRVFLGTFNDGFIHAGNLAYMAVLAIFPFFITGAAIFSIIGEDSDRAATVNAVMLNMPAAVREVIEPVARSVIETRTGWLLWISGFFGLWTVGSLVETIRDMLRRAYGTQATKAFWKYRLLSTGIIVVAVLLLLLSLIAQVLIGAAQQVIDAFFPQFNDLLNQLAWSRFVPGLGLFGSIYLLFLSLTPANYRHRRYPKWPGALLVTVWWVAVTVAMPPLLRSVFSYDLTYGSLAGIMIALFFFWLVGLGMVAGAELNAAMAETPEEERDRIGQVDNRRRATMRLESAAQTEESNG